MSCLKTNTVSVWADAKHMPQILEFHPSSTEWILTNFWLKPSVKTKMEMKKAPLFKNLEFNELWEPVHTL